MTEGQLFDLFVGGQTSAEEIAGMDLRIIMLQVAALRREEPDNIPMTSTEIAQCILAYARREISEE